MSCPPKVQAALSSVEGVEDVDVDFETKTATVTTNGKADTAEMIRALEEAGFGSEVTSN